MSTGELIAPLEEAVRVRPRLLPGLKRLKIKRAIDLLNHFPRTYSERTKITRLRPGMHASISGRVVSCENKATRRRRLKLTEVVIDDGTGSIKAVFFNQPWLAAKLRPGSLLRVSGPVDFSYGSWSIKPSGFEIGAADKPDGLEADYPQSEGVSSDDLAELLTQLIPLADRIPDLLPAELAAKLRLMPVAEAYRQAHFPQNRAALTAALLALKYREFFMLQCGLRMRRRAEADDTGLVIAINDDLRTRALKYFPFEFTGAQTRVSREIEDDLTSPGRMQRLLQGDVGCGKTAVALYTALMLLDNGYQVALMAPTEVLARQHLASIGGYLAETQVRVELLLGGMRKSERLALLEDVERGAVHILIGTHALIEPDVRFKKLGLCIVDEQHKFGVRQRAALRAKGDRPHVLAMSATPIPRTLSMTLYGSLDVSVIDELPPGRTPVITDWVHRKREEAAYIKIGRELKDGGRAYFIYPLVEDSDALELRSAVSYADELEKLFPEFRVGLVHGQMAADEKAAAMQAFREGDLDILCATVVVEVGVDVPEANIMVIENAERFGLAQLHQLRGRIGRGRRQSYLYLFGDPRTDDAIDRLEVICRTTDGFEIAEADLKMRGFGDFAGTRQSGLPKLHIGDFESDLAALERARKDAAIWGEKVDQNLLETCLELHFGRKYRLLEV